MISVVATVPDPRVVKDWLGFYWFCCWWVGLAAASFFVSKRVHWSLGPVFFVVVQSGLRQMAPGLNQLPVDLVVRLYMHVAESALFSFFATLAILFCLSIKEWTRIFKGLAVVNAAILLVSFLIHPRGVPVGILVNASLSGCFAAVLLPLFNYGNKVERWLGFVVFVSAVASGRSLPIAVLFSMLIVDAGFCRQWKRILAVLPILALSILTLRTKHFLDSDGRFWVWNESWKYFIAHVPKLTGAGLGSYYVHGLMVTEGKFTWLHSDWGQLGFELGVVGLAVTAMMYYCALRNAWLRSKIDSRASGLFTALLGYGAFALANLPLRYPLCGLYGVFLIRWAFDRKHRLY